jgi:3-methyladenine DNA glycosylase AlkD
VDVERWAYEVDQVLRAAGTADRAAHEKGYLRSELIHYGVRVPAVRSTVHRALRREPAGSHDDVIALTLALRAESVHERRSAAAELLASEVGQLRPADFPLLEKLLRESRTWALVDVLAPRVVGPLAERFPETGVMLDRWAVDEDFWMRRAAILALLLPLRRGGGDFDRFTLYADSMLDDTEFFVRKALGWVLRETAKKRPAMVADWVAPRARRMSGVTFREAIKPLDGQQRNRLDVARRAEGQV